MHRQYVLASGNRGKLCEITAMLKPLGYVVRAQAEWQVPPALETATTFLENALLKARQAARCTGLPCIADDSGLVVPALNGAPGIISARFAAGHVAQETGDRANIHRLLDEMQGLAGTQRRAYFYCCMVLLNTVDDPAPLLAIAHWHGEILDSPRGSHGFGYDPVFGVVDANGQQLSAAELPPQAKRRISHRGQALRSLVQQLRERDGA